MINKLYGILFRTISDQDVERRSKRDGVPHVEPYRIYKMINDHGHGLMIVEGVVWASQKRTCFYWCDSGDINFWDAARHHGHVPNFAKTPEQAIRRHVNRAIIDAEQAKRQAADAAAYLDAVRVVCDRIPKKTLDVSEDASVESDHARAEEVPAVGPIV